MEKIKLYEVGGHVRDSILGVPSHDIDYAVVALSYDAMREYVDGMGQILVEYPEFVTIKAKIDRDVIDFVLCRKDGSYSDGRHPDTVEAGTLYDDLARRDFTMNAIARDVETGEIIDPYGGILALESGIISCVGDAQERVSEDPLRMIRGIRFAITKRMRLDDELSFLFLQPSIVKQLETVSEDRIRQELHKMFKHDTCETLNYLSYFPILRNFIFGENSDIWLLPTTKK